MDDKIIAILAAAILGKQKFYLDEDMHKGETEKVYNALCLAMDGYEKFLKIKEMIEEDNKKPAKPKKVSNPKTKKVVKKNVKK